MANLHKEKMTGARSGVKLGLHHLHQEKMATAKGRFIIELKDAVTGKVLDYREQDNIITLDAGILVAMLLASSTNSRALSMLAVGTGATGDLLSPDAPDPRQRSLNAEIERKAFSSAVFRASDGSVSAVPTNVVDFTTTYGEGEAVGPLNEMGLMSTISDNPLVLNQVPAVFPTYDPTVDLTQFDILMNYLSFSVISKPSTAILTLTWRVSL